MRVLYITVLRSPKVHVFFRVIYTPVQQYTRLQKLLLMRMLLPSGRDVLVPG
jgi:hypothetical protein